MSGDAYAVVRLDILEGREIDRVADAALDFLATRGIVGEQTSVGWAPGPSYREVLADGVLEWYAERQSIPRMDRIANDVVIHRQWRGFFAISAFAAPSCPRCGAAAQEDDYYRHHGDWWEKREPTLHCAECGADTLQGDWNGDRGDAFGAPAVEFTNWDELRMDFVNDLRLVMGGRTAYVYTKF